MNTLPERQQSLSKIRKKDHKTMLGENIRWYTNNLIKAGHSNPREFWRLLNDKKRTHHTIRAVLTSKNGTEQYHTDEETIQTEFARWWGNLFTWTPNQQGQEPWARYVR